MLIIQLKDIMKIVKTIKIIFLNQILNMQCLFFNKFQYKFSFQFFKIQITLNFLMQKN